MRRRNNSYSYSEIDCFNSLIEQQKVDDITIDVLYRSRTISVLVVIWLALVYCAFSRSSTYSFEYNLYHAFIAICIVFLLISIMIAPNGPFTRPHPAVWRIVFGASLLYFLCLVGTVFLRLEEARSIMIWVYPELKQMRHSDILDKEYAVNCSQVSLARIYSHLDIFAAAHFLGWVGKAILLRHHIIAWTLSVNWEITEVAFVHILPNFSECWWDSLILDVLVCNGLGIQVGMWLCKWLEIRSYKWESIRNIATTRGKLKRVFLQFTPSSWTRTQWLSPDSSVMRSCLLCILIVTFQLAELNCFFLKHIFIVRPGHFLTMFRLLIITTMSAPAIRQYYLYVIHPDVKRLGSQLWLFLAIILTESIVCIKLASEVFERTILWNLVYWVVWMIFTSFLSVWIGRYWTNDYLMYNYNISKTFLTSDSNNCTVENSSTKPALAEMDQLSSHVHNRRLSEVTRSISARE